MHQSTDVTRTPFVSSITTDRKLRLFNKNTTIISGLKSRRFNWLQFIDVIYLERRADNNNRC